MFFSDVTRRHEFSSESKSEVDKSAHFEALTIIWYGLVSALAVLLLVAGACSARVWRRRLDKPYETREPTTPAPPYSEFAPPSYEAAMRSSSSSHIVVVNCPTSDKEKDESYRTPSA